MVSLPQSGKPSQSACTPGAGCGTTCGAGLEKLYPTTAVRWGAMNWLGEFSYQPNTVFRCGAKVIIQTERGTELGQQVSLYCNGCNKAVTREQVRAYIDASGPEFYKLQSGRILGEATPDEIARHEQLAELAREDRDEAALIAAQLSLDMNIVMAERLLGGERITYYFLAEQRVDFRDLVRELSRRQQCRIELRQVAARDEARLLADYEICGRECCCRNFLKKIRPVTMRMAKVQKSTLDPAKLSGRCGRLRCCLRYEHEGYEALDKKLPKVGARVQTASGIAVVTDRQVLTQLLMVRGDDNRDFAVPIEDVQAVLPKLPTVQPAPDGPPAQQQRRPHRPGPRPDTQPEPPADAQKSAFLADDAHSESFSPPDPGDLTDGAQPHGPAQPADPAARPRRRRGRRRPRSDRGPSDAPPPPAEGGEGR